MNAETAIETAMASPTGKRLRACYPGTIRFAVPLASYTTLRVGGPALALVEPTNIEDLSRLRPCLEGLPWWVLGRGSNVLVPDQGLDGVVVLLGSHLAAVDVLESDPRSVLVRVEAGCSLARLVRWCVEQGFSGLEFAAGIPGSVGGAVVMNAGAWGREMASVVAAVTVMEADGSLTELASGEVGFGYRSSSHLDGRIVVAVVMRLGLKEPQAVDRACQDVLARRRAKQPLDRPSAGSFFRNPSRAPAGRLIEEAGLKGVSIGGAKVSERHANFIVNTGNATASDIYRLMRLVQERVAAVSGVMLEPEVRLLGDWNAVKAPVEGEG